MSDIVERAREALDGTTPGPWEASHERSPEWEFSVVRPVAVTDAPETLGLVTSRRDADFIAATPQLVHELCVEVERLREERSDQVKDLGKALDIAEAQRNEARAEAYRLHIQRDCAQVEWEASDRALDSMSDAWRKAEASADQKRDVIARVRGLSVDWEGAESTRGGLNLDEADAWNLAGEELREALDGEL